MTWQLSVLTHRKQYKASGTCLLSHGYSTRLSQPEQVKAFTDVARLPAHYWTCTDGA